MNGESRSFLKKRAKKLLTLRAGGGCNLLGFQEQMFFAELASRWQSQARAESGHPTWFKKATR
jgi:hypothetical protein